MLLNPSKPTLGCAVRSTLEFYDSYADRYVTKTVGVDMSAGLSTFLSALGLGGAILDVGCGSGRDAQFFLDHGYEVVAVDGSGELAAIAAQRTGLDVTVQRFDEIRYADEFDGIWACASLLHCPRDEIGGIVENLIGSLKVGGVFYMSFKCGTEERVADDGRFFNDYTPESLAEFLGQFSNVTVEQLWTNGSSAEDASLIWTNAIIRRQR